MPPTPPPAPPPSPPVVRVRSSRLARDALRVLLRRAGVVAQRMRPPSSVRRPRLDIAEHCLHAAEACRRSERITRPSWRASGRRSASQRGACGCRAKCATGAPATAPPDISDEPGQSGGLGAAEARPEARPGTGDHEGIGARGLGHRCRLRREGGQASHLPQWDGRR